MVVTRKKPSQPAPVASRTNSSQSVPRVVKGKAPQTNDDGAVTTENGVSSGKDVYTFLVFAPPKSKSKHAARTHISLPPPKPPSLLERLFLPSLFLFFIYTLLVCPSDIAHKHSVCRSLSAYRHRILEPYILPPLRTAISHPIIQEPYKTHVEPVLEKVITASGPVVNAAKVAERKVRPVVLASYNKGKTVYEGVVVPWWNRAVVPRYNIHIAPHVERHLGPAYTATERYVAQLYPAYNTLLELYLKTKPYVQKAYETARPHAIRLWAQAKPFLCRAWDVIKVQSRVVLKTLGVQVRRLAVELVNARRQYVDPHILRIWEKVSESGTSSASGKEEGDIIRLDDIPETEESSIAPTPTPVVSPSPSPIPSSSQVTESVEATPTPAETANDEVVTPLLRLLMPRKKRKKRRGVTPTPAPEPEITSTAEEPVPTAEAEEEASASSIIASSAGGASVLVDDAVLPTTAVPEEEAEEIDDFLRDLGLDNSSAPPSEGAAADAPAVPPPKQLTPEEKLAETAAKRTDIVGRHVRWQAELDSLAKEKERSVKKAIEDVRAAAVEELKEMSKGVRDNSGKLRSSKDKDTKPRGVVDGVQYEGEKLLKGVDTYLSKAEKRSEGWKRVPGEYQDKEVKEKKRAEEEGKWGRVLEKVEEKEVREREIVQVLEAAHEVKLLAERAQADIGLDYAWLDDVTYHDWQKYHDLMRTSDVFEQTARSLQNSTHPAHPSDPVLGALNALEREMQDVVAGFNVRIAELASLGRGVFSPFVDGEEEETMYSVKDVPKDDVEGVNGAGVLLGGKEVVGGLDVSSSQEEEEQVVLGLGEAPAAPLEGKKTEEEEPKFSILPVADEQVEKSENENVVDASKIVIGKSKEEVEGVLGGVSHEEL
ncbi:hypothetical protein BDQ17DRAFT_1543946 [Cyathus striatus]|nr:hypothetical protein BDQ17DRAFT_1543946 [Cyathus striatus]